MNEPVLDIREGFAQCPECGKEYPVRTIPSGPRRGALEIGGVCDGLRAKIAAGGPLGLSIIGVHSSPRPIAAALAKLDRATHAAMNGSRALLLVAQFVHVQDALKVAGEFGATLSRPLNQATWPNGGSLLVATFEAAWRGTLQGCEFDVIEPEGVMDDRLRPTRKQRRDAK